jgi:hypothetical protein
MIVRPSDVESYKAVTARPTYSTNRPIQPLLPPRHMKRTCTPSRHPCLIFSARSLAPAFTLDHRIFGPTLRKSISSKSATFSPTCYLRLVAVRCRLAWLRSGINKDSLKHAVNVVEADALRLHQSHHKVLMLVRSAVSLVAGHSAGKRCLAWYRRGSAEYYHVDAG